MLDFNLEETLSKLESPLREKVSTIDGMGTIEDLDAPIAKHIDIQEKTGKFSGNPTIEGVSSWIKEINPN